MTRRLGLLSVGALVAIVLALFVVLAPPAAADNCGSPEDCEDTGGYNGAIGVVGGATAVAAAAAAAVAAASGDDGIPGTEDDESIDLSILQVSVDRVYVDTETSAQVVLTGWHVGADGQHKRAPMNISVQVPPATGLQVSPVAGTSQVTVTIEVVGETNASEVIVNATGEYRGNSHTEQITVEIGDDLELRLE